MIANVIPILFKALLPEAALNSDIQNELYSSPEVLDNIFDDLTAENADQMWQYPADLVKEGSDLEESIILECNYLHIAIQLQRVDIVEKLLAWGVDIQTPLVRKGNISPRQLDGSAILEGDYQGPFNGFTPFILVDQTTGNMSTAIQPLYMITPLMLADQTGNIEIITQLKQAEKVKTEHIDSDEKGYETDTDIKNAQKPQRYKNRLVIGDGNFSYSRALAEKQRQKGYEQFPTALTVTEYSSQNDLSSTYSSPETKTEFKNFNANLAALQEMGAELFSGVDATRVHELFSEKRYRRIHFNFPYYCHVSNYLIEKMGFYLTLY